MSEKELEAIFDRLKINSTPVIPLTTPTPLNQNLISVSARVKKSYNDSEWYLSATKCCREEKDTNTFENLSLKVKFTLIHTI